ncbi:MAG: outer membrane beta-barrel protein, partial [Sulfurovum sp.]|nr:outer membrane beta-barrel protein [Sulfurovum sp.]
DRDLVQDIDTIYSAFVLPGYPYEYRPFLVDTRFSPADYYDGYIDETSPYLSWMSKPLEDLEVVLGLRYVNLDQTIYQYKKDSTNNSGLIVKEPSTLAIDDVFPSLSIKYKHSEKQYIDLAVSKTYIMPDMREFTAGLYAHPSEVANIVGNPDLVYSLIYNLDFQYSYFYSDDENVKLGLFYKYMDKPIEDVQLPSSSLPLYSFINSESATLYGFEIDGRKKLDFIDSSLAEYYISGNFSYNFSEVTLTEEQKETYTSDTRELQGLSPYVFNLTLGYENEHRSATLNFNYMSERIRKVGVVYQFEYPDQYEIPPMLLDFVWIEKFNYGYDFEFKTKIGNILDEETEWSEGGYPTRLYKDGRTLSMGLSAKF